MSTSLNRIQIKDTDDTNLVTVAINPTQINVNDSTDNSVLKTIDSHPIVLNSNFDGRIQTLTWDIFLNSNSVYSSLVTTLRNMRNTKKKIHLKDLDYFNLGWREIFVTNVETRPLSGGELKIPLIFQYFYTDDGTLSLGAGIQFGHT